MEKYVTTRKLKNAAESKEAYFSLPKRRAGGEGGEGCLKKKRKKKEEKPGSTEVAPENVVGVGV